MNACSALSSRLRRRAGRQHTLHRNIWAHAVATVLGRSGSPSVCPAGGAAALLSATAVDAAEQVCRRRAQALFPLLTSRLPTGERVQGAVPTSGACVCLVALCRPQLVALQPAALPAARGEAQNARRPGAAVCRSSERSGLAPCMIAIAGYWNPENGHPIR